MGSDQDAKEAAARQALEILRGAGALGGVLGFGAGTTLDALVALMRRESALPPAAVAASVRTAASLMEAGVRVVGLAEAGGIPFYMDGADWVDENSFLIKGGAGQMTGEKILAAAADSFLCMVGENKLVQGLTGKPVPVEVLGEAAGPVQAWCAAEGLELCWRRGFLSRNGNLVGDVHGLALDDPWRVEGWLGEVPGLVESGIFARRRPDQLLVGRA